MEKMENAKIEKGVELLVEVIGHRDENPEWTKKDTTVTSDGRLKIRNISDPESDVLQMGLYIMENMDENKLESAKIRGMFMGVLLSMFVITVSVILGIVTIY